MTDLLFRSVDLIRLVYSNNEGVVWALDEAIVLRMQLMEFKERGIKVLAKYQPSGIETLKRHLQNQLHGDLKMLEGIEFNDVGSFGYAQALFRKLF